MPSTRKITTDKGTVLYQARWRARGRSCAKNFNNKRDANAYARRMGDLVENRGVGDPERLTVGAFLVRAVDEIEASGDYSPVTVNVYRKRMACAAQVLGSVSLSRLTTAEIDAGLTQLMTGDKPLARTTVDHVHKILVIVLNRAVRRGLIAHNPAVNASPGRRKSNERRKPRAFSPEEVTALLAAAAQDKAPDTLAIVSLLLATGLRRAEILGIKVTDVDFEAKLVHVRGTVVEINGRPVERARGKSAAAQRTLALPPTVVALLRAQRARVAEMMLAAGAGADATAYLFPALMGRPMSPPWFTKRLKRLMRTAGIAGRAPCHAWRHTCGTLTFDASTNIKLVQARLGHANISTTMQLYVHSLDAREREAADHFEQLLTRNKT